MSDTSSSSGSSNDGSTARSPPPTPIYKLHLDPMAVMTLASSIPNCTHVTPPDERSSAVAGPTSPGTLGDASSGYFSSFTFSTFSRTFSSEAGAREAAWKSGDDEILSFLVSDAYSVEKLAAEAEGKHASTSELDGAGMARIDVYCQSGTVITCRVMQTHAAMDDLMESKTESTLEEAPSFVQKMLPPPRKENATPQTALDDIDNQNDDYQVRRIIKRKCNLDALRKILEQPPKLTEINESIIAAPNEDGMCVSSPVSKALRRRNQKRQKGSRATNLSKTQEEFMKAQQLKYEKRRLKEEKVREQMANAILAGGMGGAEGVDLASVQSLPLEDKVSASHMSKSLGSTGSSHLPHSDAFETQKAIQEKIEIADLGLAILMAEAQRLERMMSAMHEKERLERDSDACEDESKQGERHTDREDDGDDSSLDSQDSDARKEARIMQGCEVQYSFPFQYHDVLEAALMCEDVEEESDSSDDSDSSRESYASKQMRRRRGRSPPKMGGKRQEEIHPIVAIPTNGEGCVVLRESGAFDVIGKIPDVLQKKLFRPTGPLPDQIALGTMGRYFVRFADGSFYFYGPSSLNKVLTKAKKNRRGKDRNRGKRDDNPIASVAFGKQLDDWFVVRSDGSWESNGDIPSGLDELMQNRKGRGDLLWVALGVDNEWCVSARNGRVWWEGVSEEADEALTEILGEDGENELKFVDFGPNSTYFLLHK